MDDALVAGPNLDGANEFVFRKAGGQYIDAEMILAAGTECEVIGNREHQVGLAEVPAFGELLGRRGFFRSPVPGRRRARSAWVESIARSRTNALIIAIFTSMARSLLRTLESIETPCSVNA